MTEGSMTILQLQFDVARRELQQARKEVEQLKKRLESLERSTKKLTNASESSAKAVDKEARANREAADAADQHAKAQRRIEDATDRTSSAYKRQQQVINRLRSQQDAFDETSRRVQLAGDVQSNLGAIGGLAGAAGATGAAGGIGVAGELVVLAEELPRLKTAAAGLPGTISSAAGAIGIGGAVAAVGLVGAIAGLSFAAEQAKKRLDEATAAQERRTTAIREANELTGEGSEGIREAAESGFGSIETARENLEDLSAEREALEAQYAEQFGRDISDLTDFQLQSIQKLTPFVATEGDQKINEVLQARKDENAALEEFLGTSETTGEILGKLDEEETRLADERQRQIEINRAAVADIQKRAQVEQEIRQFAQTADQEALDARRAQFENQRTTIQEQIAELEALDESGGVAAARIGELQADLQNLADKESLLNSIAAPLIQKREAEAEAIEKQDAALQARLQEIEAGIQEEVNLAKLQRTATVDGVQSRLQALQDERDAIEASLPELSKLAKDSEDAAKQLENARGRLTDIGEEYGALVSQVLPSALRRAQSEVQDTLRSELTKLEQERVDAVTDAQEKITDITKDANNDLAEIERDRQTAIAEFQREEKQRVEDFQDELRDIERQGRRERLDAAGSLDAIALRDAILNEQEQTQAAQERFEKENERRKEEREAIERRFEERRQEREREFQEQRAAAERELQQTRQKYDQQEAELRANAQRELTLLQQRFQRERQLYAQANSQIVEGVQNVVARVGEAFDTIRRNRSSSGDGNRPTGASAIETGKQKILDALGATGGGTNSGGDGRIRSRTTIQRFASGGVFEGASPGLAVLEPGERVLNNRQTVAFERMVSALERIGTGSGGRNATMNNTFNGVMPRQVIDQIMLELEAALE